MKTTPILLNETARLEKLFRVHALGYNVLKACYQLLKKLASAADINFAATSRHYIPVKQQQWLLRLTLAVPATIATPNEKTIPYHKKGKLLFQPQHPDHLRTLALYDTRTVLPHTENAGINKFQHDELHNRTATASDAGHQAPAWWEAAEELAKIGSWEYNLVEGKLYCSKNVYRLFNITTGTIPKHFFSFLQHFSQQDRIGLKDQWDAMFTAGTPLDCTVQLANQANPDGWLRIKAKPVLQNAIPYKVTGTVQDVSEQKARETMLLHQKDQAAQALQVKADFVSLMSHEIRTPLSAIIGFSHLLLQQENMAGEQLEHLHSIQFSSQNLLALLNNTLDFSRIESGKIELEKVNFRLKHLLAGIHRSLSLRAAEKQLDFKLHLSPLLPEEVAGDSARLMQILNNLLSNAIKFTDKGSVCLAADVVYQSDRDWVLEFVVSDTGPGIPEERQQHIFESFVQASPSTHRQYGGTGLGLAITKKLVELHQGKIELQSEPGKGTSFRVLLRYTRPLEEQAMAGALTPPTHEATLQGLHILLADDNAFNRMLAGKLLLNWQARVDTAENGLEAIQKLEHTTYNLVLMDLHMPVMTGFEAIAHIRSKGLALPVVAFTANSSLEEKNKVFVLGANDYLTKPFRPQDLLHCILKHTAAPAVLP